MDEQIEQLIEKYTDWRECETDSVVCAALDEITVDLKRVLR